MALTVNDAFKVFMKDIINLDADVVESAKKSRDNLLDNIAEFDNATDFFNLWGDINIQFGSFARKTKCRELDDIDLMIGILGGGATYNSFDAWNNVRIFGNSNVAAQRSCMNMDGTLNSTSVTNRFKKKLETVREYSRSEIRRNGEAVVLNLVSRDWSFDIVPCFQT